jgi:hypothetical protein
MQSNQPTTAAPDASVMDFDAAANEFATRDGFSFGDAPYSILFTADQIAAMKQALITYETGRRNKTPVTVDIVVEEVAAAPTNEPASYPVFNLSSIVYRTAGDWTVWIGGQRITPNSNEGTLRVVRIGPGIAQFSWKPAFADSYRQRYEMSMFAATDSVKHKMTRPNTAMFDEENNQVFFTLKPNQSFSPGYMATFEGRVPPPTLSPLLTLDAKGNAIMQPMPAPTDAPAVPIGLQGNGLAEGSIKRMYDKETNPTTDNNPQDNMDQLLKNQQDIQAVMPNNTPPGTPTTPPAAPVPPTN